MIDTTRIIDIGRRRMLKAPVALAASVALASVPAAAAPARPASSDASDEALRRIAEELAPYSDHDREAVYQFLESSVGPVLEYWGCTPAGA